MDEFYHKTKIKPCLYCSEKGDRFNVLLEFIYTNYDKNEINHRCTCLTCKLTGKAFKDIEKAVIWWNQNYSERDQEIRSKKRGRYP